MVGLNSDDTIQPNDHTLYKLGNTLILSIKTCNLEILEVNKIQNKKTFEI